MDLFWKQFAGSGTDSEHNVFLKARLKLTALYVLIVAVIVFGFSIFLYQSIGQNLKDASDDEFAGVEFHRHFVENTLGSLKDDLILADIVILGIAAGLSFVLAGKTLKPIQLSVEAQKAFAANASHELRTPLAVMRNDIEVFNRNKYPTKELIQGTMDSNLEEIKRMSGIVENLLLLARSDSKALPKHENVDLGVLTRGVVERMKSLVESKNIKITYETTGPIGIKGARGSLERAISNILQNSIDHTPEGGSIGVKIKKEGSQAVLKITDTGHGIAAKDLPHVFKRFYKGDSTAGTGLGLSIVKEIIDHHDGHISIESVESSGTTVTIHFPTV
jgi:two-component system sensor histidine kinase CiaH